MATKAKDKESTGAGLVAYTAPKSAASEAYRTLRTNIQFASPDKPVHTLLATSTRPDDGKSTTIANLAITFQEVVAARPNIVRRIPSEAEVAGWIAESKDLEKVVEH